MNSLKSQPSVRTVNDTIVARTTEYAELPAFRLFGEDVVPVERFPAFLREQYVASRWFQDLIWANTEIAEGPFAEFAAEHRRRDSGHHKWAKSDLAAHGIQPMTDDDWFSFDLLPTRIQLARMLARTHEATPEERLVMLGALEAAGTATLPYLNAYIKRHGLKSTFLGDSHMALEDGQWDAIQDLAEQVMASTDQNLIDIVDLVFDALTTMFTLGARRYYGDLLNQVQ